MKTQLLRQYAKSRFVGHYGLNAYQELSQLLSTPRSNSLKGLTFWDLRPGVAVRVQGAYAPALPGYTGVILSWPEPCPQSLDPRWIITAAWQNQHYRWLRHTMQLEHMGVLPHLGFEPFWHRHNVTLPTVILPKPPVEKVTPLHIYSRW